MLSPKLEEAINKQIDEEIYSSYLYYSMSTFFDFRGLKGFSHWLRVQSIEELTHVQKFATFISDRGGRTIMHSVNAPPCDWDSPLSVFTDIYQHEVGVTALVNALMDLALAESDYATVNFLQWFVGEQVEEESTADDVVRKLKLVEKTEGGLFLLDQEMDKRTFVPPPELAGMF